jgi:hypothetical protein
LSTMLMKWSLDHYFKKAQPVPLTEGHILSSSPQGQGVFGKRQRSAAGGALLTAAALFTLTTVAHMLQRSARLKESTEAMRLRTSFPSQSRDAG